MGAGRESGRVGQHRLDAAPDEEASPEPGVPEAASDSPRAAAPAIEELPGGAGAELRERQRRWHIERDRFERAERGAGSGDASTDLPPG